MALLLLSFFTLAFLLPSNVCGNAELKVLMDMKSSLDPTNQYLSSWTEEGDPCSGTFVGVACNEHGKVANVSLQSKGLSGSIPPAVSGLKCLSGLYLHYNSLTGEIPKGISNLTELSDLYLGFNNLSGSIPAEIGHMASLQVLQLGYNQLAGSIPTELGSLKNLGFLSLEWNRLTGSIPSSLADLATLKRLDVSFNQLDGPIPEKLAKATQLVALDVRNNNLSGNVPQAFKKLNEGFKYENNTALCGVGYSSLRACGESSNVYNSDKPEAFGSNSSGIDTTSIPQSANVQMHCHIAHCHNSSRTSTLPVVVGVTAIVAGGTVAGILAFIWYRRRKQKIGNALESSDSRLSTDQAKDLSRQSNSPLVCLEYSNGWDPLANGRSGSGVSYEIVQGLTFNLEEVESATQYFSEVNLLGKCSFAATYRGILREGSVVAVKSINKTSFKLEEAEFLRGLKILASLRHENLVGLKGFCLSSGRGECFLIYEFVSNGRLSQYLDLKDGDEKVLNWPTRVYIINGIAKGIGYLHSDNPSKVALVHQNISAEKVLIDQHFNPKISDSGMHKLLADDAIFSTLKASAGLGYLAPEYATTGRFTEKSDIYAFGVIILQILSGKRRISHLMHLGAEFNKLAVVVDDNLHGNFFEPEAASLAKIAILCTNEDPEQRPAMEIVIQALSNCCSTC